MQSKLFIFLHVAASLELLLILLPPIPEWQDGSYHPANFKPEAHRELAVNTAMALLSERKLK